ncbi:MAG: hypothetical protein VX254_05095, partial [Planctomycetota bacterium]|nr:hypothetical protein [Planctomycetota bacterium]
MLDRVLGASEETLDRNLRFNIEPFSNGCSKSVSRVAKLKLIQPILRSPVELISAREESVGRKIS